MAATDNIARGMAGRVAKIKVDKVPGKGLSTNDFTDADKQKLDAITNPMQIVGRVDTVADLDNITPTPAAGSIYLVGLESDPDKEEYVYTEEGTWEYLGAHIPIDSELSTTSTNPVQNRIVTAAVNEKLKAIAAADAYDPSHTYVAGEYMTLDGELYKYDANGSAIPVGENLLKTYASRLKDSTYGYRDNTSWSSSNGGTLQYNVSNFYITGTIPVTSGKTYRINSSAYTKWRGNEYSGAIFTNSSTGNTVQKWVQYSTDGSASVVTTESNAPYLSISIFKANESQYSVYEMSTQKFTKTTITDELKNLVSEKADITLIAAEYDNTATYTKGAYTIHDGKYYKANTDISTAEAWNSSHWDEVTVGGELKNITDNEVGQFYPYNENGTIYIGEIFNDYSTNETRGLYGHAEGQRTKATGHVGHAEGYKTTAHYHAHAEGDNTTATGNNSHAEGSYTNATGSDSHSEGYYSTASGDTSHSEGSHAVASSTNSHAEGGYTTASSFASHAEGYYSTASGGTSHAEGSATTASGDYSHSQNQGTIAKGTNQTALGKFNIEDNNEAYAVIIGNGTSDNARSNALTVEWNGTTRIAGNKVITTADFDNTPTTGSSNPVTSDGIKAAFDADQAEIDWAVNTGVKNLFEITAETQVINGITFTVDKAAGTVTVNGTPTDPEYISAFQAGRFYGEQGKEYILTGDPGGGGADTHYLRITYYGNDYGGGYTFTQGANYGYIEVTMRAGYAPNNIIFKPMIRPSSITDPTFEPYAKSNSELTAQLVTVTNTGDVYIGSQLIRKILTQAEYDLLDPPDPKVDYLIVPAST